MSEQQRASTPTTSPRRRIVAAALVVGVALCVSVGIWALQENKGSEALTTVAVSQEDEKSSPHTKDAESKHDKSATSTTSSAKSPSKEKSKDSSSKSSASGTMPSSTENVSQTKAQDEPADQQEIVEVHEAPEEVEQPVEEPAEIVEAPAAVTQEVEEPVAEEPEEQAQEEPEPTSVTVQVVVDGSPAGGSQRDESVELDVGANAYDALLACGADVNARSTVYGAYVAAIDGLAEKEHGSMSGWVYAVNGVEPSTACSNYVLQDGDVVVWTYVNVED